MPSSHKIIKINLYFLSTFIYFATIMAQIKIVRDYTSFKVPLQSFSKLVHSNPIAAHIAALIVKLIISSKMITGLV
ncbi:hypothetical protein C3B55_00741 [Candidatus Pseudomonas adelgestsugas]|uniref:DoxX n=1 Tax=Candidatus Pseudomonas adelgestsugas TaxID=1302376 RepID=A0ABX5R8T0_9PSED|nr:hypothetical protein C3B55_00741 [Candidatus Pseudomonas adelgestsugas]